MVPARRSPLPLLALLGALAAPWMAMPSRAQETSFEEAIEVRRLLVDVRVMAATGEALLGLGPGDFNVRLDGHEVEVEAVDGSGVATPLGSAAGDAGGAPRPGALDPSVNGPGAGGGRLVVLFFQRDLLTSRAEGLLRMAQEARRLFHELSDGDRAAIVSYGSWLHVHTDFTDDRERLLAALATVMPYRELALEAAPPSEVSLGLDPAEARRAATVERALALVASSLQRLEGSKSLLFLGWGLQPNRAFAQAAAALHRGGTAFFALDVTRADYHTLEELLRGLALATGGLFLRTYDNPAMTIEVVAAAVAGHYRLTLVAPPGRGGVYQLSVRLRGRRGTVLHPETLALRR